MKQRIEQMKKWIRQQVPEGGKAVLGISGGKDSTIAAALCVEALGKENVIGVLMPNGNQKDLDDALAVVALLKLQYHVINIGSTYDELCTAINRSIYLTHAVGNYIDKNPIVRTNLPARLRMATLYAVAAEYKNSRVVNTCNYSEDYVGYSTKYGDAAGDFSPLGNLTVREVLAVGNFLGLPYDLVHKAPSDGMCGKTDEDNLGFTYEQLDDFIAGQYDKVPDDVFAKIVTLHKATRHKYRPIPTYERWRDNI